MVCGIMQRAQFIELEKDKIINDIENKYIKIHTIPGRI